MSDGTENHSSWLGSAAVVLSTLGIPTAIVGTISNDADVKEIREIFKRMACMQKVFQWGNSSSSSVIVTFR